MKDSSHPMEDGGKKDDVVPNISRTNLQMSNKKRRQRERNDRYDDQHSQKKSNVLESVADSTTPGANARYLKKRRIEMKEKANNNQEQVEGSEKSIDNGEKKTRKENSNSRYLKKKRMEEKKKKINNGECIGKTTSMNRYMQRKRAEQKTCSATEGQKQTENVEMEGVPNSETEVSVH